MLEQLQEAFEKLQLKLQGWLEAAVLYLPNALIALVVVIIGWVIAGAAYKLAHRGIIRAGGKQNVADLLGSILKIVVIALAFFIGLSILGLSDTVSAMLAGAGIVGLAVGFALQDPLANLFSGVLLSVKELYSRGDLVETNGFFGVIERITLRTTIIRTLQGQEVVIPNKDVLQSPLTNYTVTGLRRIDLEIGISYGDDLRRAARITREAIEQNLDYIRERPVEMFWKEFGDSSINGILRFWVKSTGQRDFLEAQSEAIMAIKEAYDREDIMIPFPIRTLDFGIRGGEKLSQMPIQWAERGSNGKEAGAAGTVSR